MKNALIYIAVLVLLFCIIQGRDNDPPPNYDDGYESGYEEGYDEGYADGWLDALKQYGIEE